MKRTLVSLGLLASNVMSCGPQSEPSAKTKGYFDSSLTWKNGPIVVCWENPLPLHQRERTWVQNRIKDTWEKYANLEFTGWGPCSETKKPNIRIYQDDKTAHTLGLGTMVDGIQRGMRLNFIFEKWNSKCVANHGKQFCVETIAIHEFGHALGMAHEHNRNDRDEDCTRSLQGHIGNTTVGHFDRDSIMSYCFYANYKNTLSDGDIHTIQQMYGIRN